MLTEKECSVLHAACCPAAPKGKPVVAGFFGDLEKKFEVLKIVAGDLKVKGYSLGQIVDVVDQALLLIDATEPKVEEIIAKVKEMIDGSKAPTA